MLTKLLRKLTATGTTEFCDTCAQACTPQCRAQAAYDRAKTHIAYQLPIIR